MVTAKLVKKLQISIIFLYAISAQNLFATVSNGGYMGIGVGVVNQLLQFQVNSFALNLTEARVNSAALGALGRLNLGYNANKYMGFELGLTYNFIVSHKYPNNIDKSIKTGGWSLDGSYLLYLPTVINKVSVFGRIGLAYDWITDGSSSVCKCVHGQITENTFGNGFVDIVGMGLKYNLFPKLSMSLEWMSNGMFFPGGLFRSEGLNKIGNLSTQSFMMVWRYHF